MTDQLALLTAEGLLRFAAAVFATPRWTQTLAQLALRPDWPGRLRALVESSAVESCSRSYPPQERCVLEVLLLQLDAAKDPTWMTLLSAVSQRHPQRELRIAALHALVASGQAGIDVAAGPPGAAPVDPDVVVQMLHAGAAIARGDAPEVASVGGTARRQALLAAHLGDFHYSADAGRYVGRGGLLERHPGWVAFTVDALFDPALASSAKALLDYIPKERWKPLADAKRKAARKKTTASPRPTKADRQALDAELKEMRLTLDAIVSTLRDQGYVFVAQPLRAPVKQVASKLRALQARIGPVPLVLAHFWAVVGAVDLRGNHPGWARKTYVSHGGEACWYADPLVITDLDSALADANDSTFDLAERGAALYDLAVCGDAVTKANVSGGTCCIRTPCSGLDAPLVGTNGTLLEHLRLALRWRGFPGFAQLDGAPTLP